MVCSVISDDIKIIVNSKTSDRVPSRSGLVSFGSALQNPDISRAALARLLSKPALGKRRAGKLFWASFLAHYQAQHANAND